MLVKFAVIKHESYQGFLTDDDEIENSDGWFNQMQSTYATGVKAAHTWLKSHAVTPPVKQQGAHALDSSIDVLIYRNQSW